MIEINEDLINLIIKISQQESLLINYKNLYDFLSSQIFFEKKVINELDNNRDFYLKENNLTRIQQIKYIKFIQKLEILLSGLENIKDLKDNLQKIINFDLIYDDKMKIK
jgi:hypothetical protein